MSTDTNWLCRINCNVNSNALSRQWKRPRLHGRDKNRRRIHPATYFDSFRATFPSTPSLAPFSISYEWKKKPIKKIELLVFIYDYLLFVLNEEKNRKAAEGGIECDQNEAIENHFAMWGRIHWLDRRWVTWPTLLKNQKTIWRHL